MTNIAVPAPLENFDFALLGSPGFKEDSVREEIILPVLNALGYTASGPNKIIRSKPLEHPFLTTGSKKKRVTLIPDYLLTVSGNFTFVLDAKGPEEEIKTGHNVEQVYSYAMHPEIRVEQFALCNGREFILFDVRQKEPLLHFHLSEISHHWDNLQNYLAPAKAATQLPTRLRSVVSANKADFDYLAIVSPAEIMDFHKQTAKRHFGVHGYFTKQVWSVVQHYIKTFTQPGDTILDPFGGSGVTLVEALMLGRKGIHIDLNPLSEFIVKNLIEPIDLAELADSFNHVKEEFRKRGPKTEKQIEQALKDYPHPKGIALPKNSDVSTVEQLFTSKQLAQLSCLKHLILKEPTAVRNCLLLMFSGLLNKVNLTYHSSEGRSEGRGDSSIFRYYRYRIAPVPAEIDIMKYFESRFNKVVAAKKEIAGLINRKTVKNGQVIKGTATDLSAIPAESVDYIYTDPPYGSKIPYLDLSVLWTSWLDLPVTQEDYAQEAIEGGEAGKTKEEYSDLLVQSIAQMGRVLKYDRWMSFVFAHKDPAYWHLIIDAAEKVGFEYAGSVKQNNGQSSFKKRQNPFTVLSGQLIINFRKVKNPKTIGKIALGAPIMDVVMETIESVIAMHHGATLEQINDELVIRGMELGFLDILAREYTDLTPLLMEAFEFDEKTKTFNLRKNRKFKTHIPLELRVRYFVVSFLKRMEHMHKDPTFDDIILNIMPLLKNGITPEHQTILNVLTKIADRVGTDRWRLSKSGQQDLLF
ncbi:DNA methyltransferase [Edaphobacter paludis]|uniref:DNA methyltransferase n=1 Tax=Edaphobacter paludis TaxID=3035702 RepID=A0AAU7D3W5_9BACT